MTETSEAQEGLPGTVEAQSTDAARTEGFDSPPEAVTAYLEGLKAGNLYRMIDTFCTDDYIDKYIPVLKSRNILALGSMADLKILGLLPPEVLSEKYDSDGMRELQGRRLKTCGAESLASCAVVFEIGGNKYVVCPDVAKYSGKWYIKTLNGQLSTLLYISHG